MKNCIKDTDLKHEKQGCLKNDSWEKEMMRTWFISGDTHANDVNIEIQMRPTDEAEDVQRQLASEQ